MTSSRMNCGAFSLGGHKNVRTLLVNYMHTQMYICSDCFKTFFYMPSLCAQCPKLNCQPTPLPIMFLLFQLFLILTLRKKNFECNGQRYFETGGMLTFSSLHISFAPNLSHNSVPLLFLINIYPVVHKMCVLSSAIYIYVYMYVHISEGAVMCCV